MWSVREVSGVDHKLLFYRIVLRVTSTDSPPKGHRRSNYCFLCTVKCLCLAPHLSHDTANVISAHHQSRSASSPPCKSLSSTRWRSFQRKEMKRVEPQHVRFSRMKPSNLHGKKKREKNLNLSTLCQQGER